MAKGSNDQALKLQKESMLQSAQQNKQMLALLQSQVDSAKTMKLPKSAGPMPLPGTSSADIIAQSQETRQNMAQRNGLLDTRKVLPFRRSAMGTPIMEAAA